MDTAEIGDGIVTTLDITATVAGLNIGATGQLNLSGNTLILDSAVPGTFTSSGLITMGGGTLSGGTGTETLIAQGTLHGTGALSNLTLSPTAGSTLILDESAGDTLTVAANAQIATAGGPVASNVLLLGSSGFASLDNHGAVSVNDGDSFTFKADTKGGPFFIVNDGSFNLNGGKLDFDNNGMPSSQFVVGTLSGTGTLNLAPGVVNSALISSAAGADLTNAQGHTIQGAGSIDSSVSFSNAGTVIANGGTLLIANSADYTAGTQTLGGANGVFQANNGSILQIGSIPAGSGIVNNYAALVLDGTGQIQNAAGVDAVTNILSNNYGTLQLQNNAYLALNTTFTNYGTLNIAGNLVTGNSTLDLTLGTFGNIQSGVLTGGIYNIAGTLLYSGDNITGIASNTKLTLSGGGSIQNNFSDAIGGSLTSNNGTLTLANGAVLQLSQSFTNSGTLNVTGNVSGTSTLFAFGDLTNNGTMNVTGQGTVDLFGANALTNSGTLFVRTAGNVFAFGGPVVNSGSITLDSTNVGISSALFEAALGFQNSGTVVIGGSDASNPTAAALIVGPGSNYVQTGAAALTQVDGILQADEVDVEGGTVTGSGLIAGLLFNNAGTVVAGDAAGGVLKTCNFTQTAGGNLEFTFGGNTPGTGYSQLTDDATDCGAPGVATLGGNIEFDFTGGYTPQLGETYNLILFGSVTGDFASFSFADLAGWTPEFTLQSDELSVTFVTPEPAPVALMTVGILLGILRLRLKKAQ